MIHFKYLLPFIILSFCVSCTSDIANDLDNVNDSLASIQIDTLLNEVLIDTTSVLPDSLVKEGYVEETKALATVIEKKFGVQWDFCDCVVKNDSINKVMSDLEGVSDEQVDLIFVRWDEIEQHCKELLTAPNTTPEERSRYSRKVKRCLRKAGVK